MMKLVDRKKTKENHSDHVIKIMIVQSDQIKQFLHNKPLFLNNS